MLAARTPGQGEYLQPFLRAGNAAALLIEDLGGLFEATLREEQAREMAPSQQIRRIDPGLLIEEERQVLIQFGPQGLDLLPAFLPLKAIVEQKADQLPPGAEAFLEQRPRVTEE